MFIIKFLFISILFSWQAYGKTLTLAQSVQFSLNNSPSAKLEKQKLKIAALSSEESYSKLLPIITASGSYNRNFDSSSNNIGYEDNPGSFTTQNYELKLTQSLYNNKNLSQYQDSKIDLNIAKIEYEIFKQDLTIKVAQSYLEYLSQKNKLLLAQAKINTLLEQKTNMKKKFELGDATIQDLSETESKYYLAISDRSKVESNLQITKLKLEQFIGKKITNHELEKLNTIDNNATLHNLDYYLKLGENNNLTIKNKKLIITKAQNNIDSANKDYLPTIDLIGSSTYYETDDSISSMKYHSKQNYIGLQGIVALYEGGATQTKIKKAIEQHNLSKYELEANIEEVKYQITQEYTKLQTSLAQLNSLEFSLKSAKTTIDAAKVGFDIGTQTHFGVLQAIEQYYTVKNSLLSTKFEYKIALLKFKMHIGTLTLQDLDI